MKWKTALAIPFSALLASAGFAQELSSLFGGEGRPLWPLAAEEQRAESEIGEKAEKSPGKALLLSTLLPGTGQFYAGAEKKGVAFLSVEAIALGFYFAWRGKGNEIEDEFREMADTSWSAEIYLAWRSTSRAIRNNSFTHALPCSLEVMNGEFDRCGKNEKQQYYELLGKYDQFVVGWNDLRDRATGNPVNAYTEIDSVEKVVSENRLLYEKKRHDSNQYLKRASNIAGLILVNHALAAIDAARTARSRSRGADAAALERRIRFLFTWYPGSQGQVPMLMAYRPFD